MKKTIWVILVLFLILGLLPLTSQAAPLQKLSWRAEYYNNNDLSGQPVSVRFEDAVDHDWGRGSPSPDISKNNFSARWTLTRHFDKGAYFFFLTVDDGARVWLDGELIIDAWSLGRKERLRTKIYIEETGDHQLQVSYFEKKGDAEIALSWLALGSDGETLAAWHGEYFSNRNLEGSPDIVRNDGAINFDWNSGGPHPKITRDNFSIRWTRTIYLDEGEYTLRIQHDDGMRVYVDNQEIYDSWRDQQVSYRTKTIDVAEGQHTFRVEYYEHLGNAIAVFQIDDDPGGHTYDDPDDDSGTIIIDNQNNRFTWSGPLNNRHNSNSGYRGSFFWTYNTHTSVKNFGKWKPTDLKIGDYEVFVYIPGKNATSHRARYRIWHDGKRSDRVIDQNDFSNQWVSLGTYAFSDNGKEGVILYDNTREAAGSTRLAYDAVKFVQR